MALDVYKLHIPDHVPPGHFAGKLIKAIYTDTKDSVFPCDGPYGKDWKKAISYLNRKKRKTACPSPEKGATDHALRKDSLDGRSILSDKVKADGGKFEAKFCMLLGCLFIVKSR